jgi:hypothetical protein
MFFYGISHALTKNRQLEKMNTLSRIMYTISFLTLINFLWK